MFGAGAGYMSGGRFDPRMLGGGMYAGPGGVGAGAPPGAPGMNPRGGGFDYTQFNGGRTAGTPQPGMSAPGQMMNQMAQANPGMRAGGNFDYTQFNSGSTAGMPPGAQGRMPSGGGFDLGGRTVGTPQGGSAPGQQSGGTWAGPASDVGQPIRPDMGRAQLDQSQMPIYQAGAPDGRMSRGNEGLMVNQAAPGDPIAAAQPKGDRFDAAVAAGKITPEMAAKRRALVASGGAAWQRKGQQEQLAGGPEPAKAPRMELGAGAEASRGPGLAHAVGQRGSRLDYSKLYGDPGRRAQIEPRPMGPSNDLAGGPEKLQGAKPIFSKAGGQLETGVSGGKPGGPSQSMGGMEKATVMPGSSAGTKTMVSSPQRLSGQPAMGGANDVEKTATAMPKGGAPPIFSKAGGAAPPKGGFTGGGIVNQDVIRGGGADDLEAQKKRMMNQRGKMPY